MAVLAYGFRDGNAVFVDQFHGFEFSFCRYMRLEKPSGVFSDVASFASGLPKTYPAQPVKFDGYAFAIWT